jgi:hypothetical protein
MGSNNNKSASQGKVWSRPQYAWILEVSILSLEVPPEWGYKALHVNEDFTPTVIFLLFFMDAIHLLMADTNKYYD